MGLDGDVTAGGQTREVDVKFDDYTDSIETGGGILLEASKGRYLVWGQLDYFELDSSNVGNGRVWPAILLIFSKIVID